MGGLRLAFAIIGWALAAAALVASVLALVGGASGRLDLFSHFAPFYLAAALLALPLSLCGPRRGRIALAATSCAGALGGAALMVPEFLAGRNEPVSSPAGKTLKVVLFNAWRRNAQPEAVTEWLLAQEPDVIVLVEAGAVRDMLRGRGFEAVCPACRTTLFSRMTPRRIFTGDKGETRSSFLVGATFGDARGEFTVIGVHRSWPTKAARRSKEAAEIRAILDGLPRDRVILAGDFNSTPWSFVHRREDDLIGMPRRTRALFSWPAERVSDNRLPAPFPYLPIDHIYAGQGWATVKVERGPRLGSDHYPVSVTLAPVESVAK